MIPSLGIEPGPHWWEASAFTAAPSLLPLVDRKVLISVSVVDGPWTCVSGQAKIDEKELGNDELLLVESTLLTFQNKAISF